MTDAAPLTPEELDRLRRRVSAYAQRWGYLNGIGIALDRARLLATLDAARAASPDLATLREALDQVSDEPLWPGAGAGITIRESEAQRMQDYRARVIDILRAALAAEEERP